MVVEIEALVVVSEEEAFSFSPRFSFVFRAASASATTAYAKQRIGVEYVIGIEDPQHDSVV